MSNPISMEIVRRRWLEDTIILELSKFGQVGNVASSRGVDAMRHALETLSPEAVASLEESMLYRFQEVDGVRTLVLLEPIQGYWYTLSPWKITARDAQIQDRILTFYPYEVGGETLAWLEEAFVLSTHLPEVPHSIAPLSVAGAVYLLGDTGHVNKYAFALAGVVDRAIASDEWITYLGLGDNDLAIQHLLSRCIPSSKGNPTHVQ